jgi:hypothetical protein
MLGETAISEAPISAEAEAGVDTNTDVLPGQPIGLS